MPTLTAKQANIVPAETIDIASMRRLEEHPRLAPLVAQRTHLSQQLTAMADQVRALRGALQALPAEDSFMVVTRRRALEDRVAALERSGAELQEQQRPLWTEIEAMENAVRGEVVPVLTAESIAVLEAYVALLEPLDVAQQAYQAVCVRNRQLVMSTILPPGLLDGYLPSRLDLARKQLVQLRQRPGA